MTPRPRSCVRPVPRTYILTNMRFTLLAVIAATAAAQVDTGTIAGTLYDATGAALANASVTITHTDTGLDYRLSSNQLGQFVSPPLAPGPYSISASLAGFRRASTRIVLTLNQRAVVSLTLELGATEQEITVTSQTPLLEAESATLGNLRTSQSVRDLPLNGRNFTTLLGLTTGVVPAQTQVQGLGLTPARGVTANSVNGAGFRANRILVDGMDNTENHNGQGIVIYPAIEAIQEFSVQTSVPPAEFGRGGGNISVRIKSGGKQFRGTLFEFLRNSALDAKNFFDPPGRTPPFRNNQFGGVFGGPLVIPGLYNEKREKTFFFFSYEGQRMRQAQTFVSSVPLAAFKRGDFSAAANTLFDPATGRQTPQGVQRDPFPGNRIPEGRLDPVGRRILELFPDPILPGQAANYRSNPSQPRTANNWDFKIDHRLREADQFFVRASRHVTNEFTPGALPAPAWGNTSAGLSRFPVPQLVMSHTHMFSPVLVNEARAGVGRLFIDSRHPNYGDNVADRVGIPGINGGTDVL
ncbi:MAG: carboxypeptidase regulatory-like domain-containing protein, partial [Acidobacteria bacterium]|nr:carboxypeptidase regulatory-like domain-containing protein [Acidobacteriota bacterium]